MSLDETIRERVLFLGGKVVGVDCPDCEFESRDVEIAAHTNSALTCPECGATILTADQKSALRQANKL